MLTKAFQEQWAAALESGKYRQGMGQLRDGDDKFCCLGVAVDLAVPDSWSRPSDHGGGWMSIVKGHEPRGGYIPHPVARELGITQMDQDTLSRLNDDADEDGNVNKFADIAKHIRGMPTRD